jgi:hypothetical protein
MCAILIFKKFYSRFKDLEVYPLPHHHPLQRLPRYAVTIALYAEAMGY